MKGVVYVEYSVAAKIIRIYLCLCLFVYVFVFVELNLFPPRFLFLRIIELHLNKMPLNVFLCFSHSSN